MAAEMEHKVPFNVSRNSLSPYPPLIKVVSPQEAGFRYGR
jgi:hypothetical protein